MLAVSVGAIIIERPLYSDTDIYWFSRIYIFLVLNARENGSGIKSRLSSNYTTSVYWIHTSNRMKSRGFRRTQAKWQNIFMNSTQHIVFWCQCIRFAFCGFAECCSLARIMLLKAAAMPIHNQPPSIQNKWMHFQINRPNSQLTITQSKIESNLSSISNELEYDLFFFAFFC